MRLMTRVIPALLVLVACYYGLNKFAVIGSAPELDVKSTLTGPVQEGVPLPVGVKPPLQLTVASQEGICSLELALKQGEISKGIFQESLPSGPSRELALAEMPINLQQSGFAEGAAELMVTARDCSFYKRKAKKLVPLVLDFTAPTVTLTSSNHYINQGGADVLTYKVTGDVFWSGVRVGPYLFKGYRMPSKSDDDGHRFAFFVFSYELPVDTEIKVIARDAAGNEAETTLRPTRLFAKNFRKRKINISDRFIDAKVKEIIDRVESLNDTGDRAKNYLLVNRELRRENANFLLKLAQKSEPKFYWDQAFLQMGNTAVEAQFADFRDYLYKGKKIDTQVHLGFDLASVKQDSVAASNSGKVVFADYLGIYGNTVVLDHGYGINTLYAHLSRIDVKPGDMVKKGQTVGLTGVTGLAGGDHLHFSLLIHGVQSNPVEFWDQHWIDDHVQLRIGSFGPQVVGAN